ncbi:MAG: hypothetical protein KME26_05955 [Oscillatoria princeps RMCB-10]|nr:hypothetical protein [Oscillatoria princeps RMCB-10]
MGVSAYCFWGDAGGTKVPVFWGAGALLGAGVLLGAGAIQHSSKETPSSECLSRTSEL